MSWLAHHPDFANATAFSVSTSLSAFGTTAGAGHTETGMFAGSDRQRSYDSCPPTLGRMVEVIRVRVRGRARLVRIGLGMRVDRGVRIGISCGHTGVACRCRCMLDTTIRQQPVLHPGDARMWANAGGASPGLAVFYLPAVGDHLLRFRGRRIWVNRSRQPRALTAHISCRHFC